MKLCSLTNKRKSSKRQHSGYRQISYLLPKGNTIYFLHYEENKKIKKIYLFKRNCGAPGTPSRCQARLLHLSLYLHLLCLSTWQVPQLLATESPSAAQTDPPRGWGTGKDALGLSVMFKGPESVGSKLEWVQTPLEEESGTFWSFGDRQHFHVEEQRWGNALKP